MYNEFIKKLSVGKGCFSIGDYVDVVYKENFKDTQFYTYTGVVIALRKRGIATSFLVRKISHNVGVEKKFLCNSPLLFSVGVRKKQSVKMSKLYYLRKRSLKIT
jgi:large subunit ribosomal protein L19